MEMGFASENPETLDLVERWPVGILDGILTSASANYLIRSGQERDLEFVLTHVADLDDAYILDGDEVMAVSTLDNPLVALEARSYGVRP
jgi:hypothetical protein